MGGVEGTPLWGSLKSKQSEAETFANPKETGIVKIAEKRGVFLWLSLWVLHSPTHTNTGTCVV